MVHLDRKESRVQLDLLVLQAQMVFPDLMDKMEHLEETVPLGCLVHKDNEVYLEQ